MEPHEEDAEAVWHLEAVLFRTVQPSRTVHHEDVEASRHAANLTATPKTTIQTQTTAAETRITFLGEVAAVPSRIGVASPLRINMTRLQALSRTTPTSAHKRTTMCLHQVAWMPAVEAVVDVGVVGVSVAVGVVVVVAMLLRAQLLQPSN